MSKPTFSIAEETALVAVRQGQPVPRHAFPTLKYLRGRGFLRPGHDDDPVLSEEGEAAADNILKTMTGLGAMIAKPHVRERA